MINSFLFYEMTYITNSCCGRIAGNNISGMNIYKVSSAVFFFIIINIAMKYFKSDSFCTFQCIILLDFSLICQKKIKNYVIIMWVGGAGREWLLLFNQEFVLISTKLWHQGNSWLDWFFSRNKNKTFWNLSSLIIADMGFCFSPF